MLVEVISVEAEQIAGLIARMKKFESLKPAIGTFLFCKLPMVSKFSRSVTSDR